MKRMNKILALCLAMIMALACLTACGGKEEPAPEKEETKTEQGGTETAPAGDPVKLGIVIPLTGGQAVYGEDMKVAMEMAAEKINSEGGVLGGELQLLIEDDASQPAQCATAATKLITQNDVSAIVGTNGSSGSLAMMEVVGQYGVPLLVPGGSSPLLTNSGSEWINTTCQGDELQIDMLIGYAHNDFDVNKLGFLYSNDDYGVGGYNLAVAAAEKHGVELVAESFMPDDQNYTAILTKLKDAGVEAVMMWVVYTPGSLLCKQIGEMGWDVMMFGGAGMVNTAVFELSGDACDGMLMTAPYLDPADEEANWFTAEFKARAGRDISYTAVHAYDSIYMLADAMNELGTSDPEKVQEKIRSYVDYPTLKGPITIEQDTGRILIDLKLVELNADTHTIDYIDMNNLSQYKK